MRWVVFDVEGNGLKPTKLYCLCWKDYEGRKGTLRDYDDIRDFFDGYDFYVGHNIRRWDYPVLQRLCGIRLEDGIIDTLGVGWYLDESRKSHTLESYGEDQGLSKVQISDWDNLSQEEYEERCRRDVEINHALWEEQLRRLLAIYETEEKLLRFLRYLDFKMYCASLAEQSGWKLDEKFCLERVSELSKIKEEKVNELRKAMPRVPVIKVYEPPKRFYNSDGQPSVLGKRWQERALEAGFSEDYRGSIRSVTGYTDPNPSSTPQLKDWLFSLGWKPRTFKYKKDENGKDREIPQINKERGDGICDSIKELYELEPNLQVLDGLSVVSSRLAQLEGFLRNQDSGRLRAAVAGFTNTLRFKHAELVNLPKPESRYGKDIRGCLVADDDHELCGSDMSGLEDRLKQHFIFPFDREYVAKLDRPDYDPHLDLAEVAKALTKEEVLAYKAGDTSKKKVRSIYKNGNYALQYKCGIKTLMRTTGLDREGATKLREAYLKLNWSITEVEKTLTTKRVGEQEYLLNPINGFWYSLRSEKDRFSTLVQGSGAYCFDRWLSLVLAEREQLTGQFHDEFILSVRKGHREEVEAFLRSTIEELNDELKLNKRLDIDVKFGERYSDIH